MGLLVLIFTSVLPDDTVPFIIRRILPKFEYDEIFLRSNVVVLYFRLSQMLLRVFMG